MDYDYESQKYQYNKFKSNIKSIYIQLIQMTKNLSLLKQIQRDILYKTNNVELTTVEMLKQRRNER